MSRGAASFGHLRSPRRGVANIIATLLLVGMTIAAGVVLWTFRIETPNPAPALTLLVRSGTSEPVWGDPSDCLPYFPSWLGYNTQATTSRTNTTAVYLLSGGSYSINPNSAWGKWWNSGLANVSGGTPGSVLYYNECSSLNPPGNFSQMNAALLIVSGHTPANLLISSVQLLFVCNGTPFVQGSLAAMTWFPGSTTQPPPDAPHLGRCGNYVPSGAYSTLANRFGIFVPLSKGTVVVENGDTFIMYIRTASPFDPDLTGWNRDPVTHVDCGPGPDCDDFHGAPAWCFTTPATATTGCTLKLYTNGTSPTLLASLPLYNLIR